MICRMDLDMFFGILKNFNFGPKVRILHDGLFSKWSHFSNISCFLERFFAQKISK